MLLDLVQIGDHMVHRGIVIAPLFPRRDPVADYVTLDEALPQGLRITEVDEAGTVPELVVDNPLSKRVLLYDGEELVGAKQNRILSRPHAFAKLWPKLRAGYLLDALGYLDGTPTSPTVHPTMLGWISDAQQARQPSVGLGEDVRIRSDAVIGSALELDGELLQLSAFTSADGGRRAFGRIARPSVRR